MKQKMRGVVDPMSLGFLISLVGAVFAYQTPSEPASLAALEQSTHEVKVESQVSIQSEVDELEY